MSNITWMYLLLKISLPCMRSLLAPHAVSTAYILPVTHTCDKSILHVHVFQSIGTSQRDSTVSAWYYCALLNFDFL